MATRPPQRCVNAIARKRRKQVMRRRREMAPIALRPGFAIRAAPSHQQPAIVDRAASSGSRCACRTASRHSGKIDRRNDAGIGAVAICSEFSATIESREPRDEAIGIGVGRDQHGRAAHARTAASIARPSAPLRAVERDHSRARDKRARRRRSPRERARARRTTAAARLPGGRQMHRCRCRCRRRRLYRGRSRYSTGAPRAASRSTLRRARTAAFSEWIA